MEQERKERKNKDWGTKRDEGKKKKEARRKEWKKVIRNGERKR